MITNTTQPLPGIYLNPIFNEEDSPDAEMLVVQPDADVDASSTTSNGDYASYGEYADYGNAAQYAPHSNEVAKAVGQGFAKYVFAKEQERCDELKRKVAEMKQSIYMLVVMSLVLVIAIGQASKRIQEQNNQQCEQP